MHIYTSLTSQQLHVSRQMVRPESRGEIEMGGTRKPRKSNRGMLVHDKEL